MVAEQTGTRPRIQVAAPRRKRRDTHVGTIEQQTGLDFGVRSDMHLGTLLERRNAAWLSEILGESLEQAEIEAEQPESPELVEIEADRQDLAPGEPDEATPPEAESAMSVELVVLHVAEEAAVAA